MADLKCQNGDLVASEYGDLVLCDMSGDTYEDEDVIQTANNSILLRFGRNKYHNDLGNNIYNRRVKASETGLSMIVEECENAILNGDSRIQEVIDVTATTGENGQCYVQYRLLYLPSQYEDSEDDEDEEDDGEDDNKTREHHYPLPSYEHSRVLGVCGAPKVEKRLHDYPAGTVPTKPNRLTL